MPDVAFWNKCNNKCVMCTNMSAFARQDTKQYELKGQIKKMESYIRGLAPIYLKNADRSDFLALTGGEPTIHPDFFRLLAYFRKRFPSVCITLLTNGRRFERMDFTRKFIGIAKPPFVVAVPIHSASPVLHDRIAGVSGSFKETVSGLENLFRSRSGQWIELRIVLHRMNISGLPDLLRFLLEKFPDTGNYGVSAIHYEIEGMSRRNHARLSLPLSESADVINRLGPVIKKFRRFELYHFPRCVIKSSLRSKCRVTLPLEDRIYTPKCLRCADKRRCLGLMKEYHDVFGPGEVSPL